PLPLENAHRPWMHVGPPVMGVEIVRHAGAVPQVKELGQIRAGRGRRRAGAGLHQGHGNAFRATAGASLIGACAGTRFEAGQARPSPAIYHLTCVKALRARMVKLEAGQKRPAACEEANMTKSRFGSAIVAVIAIALAASVSSSAVAQTQGTTHT